MTLPRWIKNLPLSDLLKQPVRLDSFVFSALLLSLVAFFPCWALQKAYYANDLLQYFAHSRSLLRDQLQNGRFPLWSPYLLGGQPFFANPNSMMCYPLNYLTLFFPVPFGLSVFYSLHMVLAFLGMGFWLRNIGLSKAAAWVGALTYSLSGFFWWHLIQPDKIAAYAWFPWFLGCLERGWRKRDPFWAFLSGLCGALIFCCGNFQSFTCVFYTGLAYLAFLAVSKEAGTRLEGVRHPSPHPGTAGLLLFALWGALPLLCQLIPALEFYGLSYRHNPILNYDNFNATFSMDPRSFPQFFFPSLGLPPGMNLEDAVQTYNLQDSLRDNRFLGVYGYLGIWAPFLALAAVAHPNKKLVFFLALLGALSLATAWGHHTPLHRLECLLLPGISLSRAPYRFIMTYALCASALAALGFQNWEGWAGSKKGLPWMAGACFYALVLLTVCCTRPLPTWRESLGLLLGILGMALWGFTDRWKVLGRWIFLSALALVALLNGWSAFSPGPPSNFDLEANFPAFTYLKSKPPESRFFFDADLTYPVLEGGRVRFSQFPQNSTMALDLRSIGGNDAFFLQRTYDLVSRLPAEVLNRLFEIRAAVLKKPIGEIKGVLHRSFPGAEVYEPLVPPPYLNAPYEPRVAARESEILPILTSAGFDPNRQVVLSRPLPPAYASRLPDHPAVLAYALEKDEPDDQVLEVRLSQDNLVVFSEVMYPGWKAWIDGERTDIYTADYAFRTLLIPAGVHRVEFRFEPSWVEPLEFGLLVWLLSVFAYLRFKGWTRPSPTRKMGHA